MWQERGDRPSSENKRRGCHMPSGAPNVYINYKDKKKREHSHHLDITHHIDFKVNNITTLITKSNTADTQGFQTLKKNVYYNRRRMLKKKNQGFRAKNNKFPARKRSRERKFQTGVKGHVCILFPSSSHPFHLPPLTTHQPGSHHRRTCKFYSSLWV